MTATFCRPQREQPNGQFAFLTSGGKNVTSAAAKGAPQIFLSALLLNLWLVRYVMEARRADRDLYPPTTIANLLSGLYWFTKNYNQHCPDFVDRKKPAFKELTGALEVRHRYLTDIHIAPCTQHSHETAGYVPLQTVTHIDAHTHTHTHTHTQA